MIGIRLIEFGRWFSRTRRILSRWSAVRHSDTVRAEGRKALHARFRR
jgi:hypothetical protein